MAKANKRIRLTDESVNSYGSRIITAGVDLEQYRRNPVLLYMHERGEIIGLLKDLKVEGTEITAEPVFDEASELSRRCKRQYEFGSLRMCSVGIDILEMSEDKTLIAVGQTRPTITRSRLFEVSLVDVGSNDNALVLRSRDGRRISLGQDGENPLPLLINNKKQEKEMDIKTLALQLGLPETADEAAVNAKLSELQAAKADADKFRKENEELQLAQITAAVEAAVAQKKINEDKKAHFVELGKKVGLESLNATFEAMAPQLKLSQAIGHAEPTQQQPAEYKKLSEVPADKIMQLRSEKPDQYRQLFKAEYGYECEL